MCKTSEMCANMVCERAENQKVLAQSRRLVFSMQSSYRDFVFCVGEKCYTKRSS